MTPLGWRRSRSLAPIGFRIDPEECITGVGLKVDFGTLGKVVQCLWLALLEVCCHLFGTGLKVLLLDEEFLHSVVSLGCFGKVYPALKIVADPSDELGRTFTWFWSGGSKPLAEAISSKLIPLQKCGL